jgi:hypothetical protein
MLRLRFNPSLASKFGASVFGQRQRPAGTVPDDLRSQRASPVEIPMEPASAHLRRMLADWAEVMRY